MTALAITGMGLTGVLRMTWVHDNLAHVLQHSQALAHTRGKHRPSRNTGAKSTGRV